MYFVGDGVVTVYYIGLIFVVLLIMVSLDDLIWDVFYLVKSKGKRANVNVVTYKELRDTTPGLLAVIVAAYNEEYVLADVIDNLIDTNHYPDAMYHVFLGVYPNDKGTMRVADDLAERHPNVHKVIHVLDGPSSKADNLNNVIKNVVAFEARRGIRFKGIVIHDSEDVVHPYELLVENYLLNAHKAIQMPVFPLQRMPKIRNTFKNMVSGTYADEFAENHYSMLVARSALGSFVPSAGTGFTLAREIIDVFPDYEVFPVGSLTEDYKLSLILKQKGFDLYYALEEVERLRDDGSVVREFIATRSIFPATYGAAVRQKTRWIYGITMQSFQLRNIVKDRKLPFLARYSLYKDWKAKFGNALLGPGYLIFAYFVLSLFFDIPTIFPKYSLSWYLMFCVTGLMVERQILRGVAVKNVYGYRSALVSVLLPPLLPFRMILGNIINFHATAKAWRMRLFPPRRQKTKKGPKWSKTDHEFLEEHVLRTFRRTLGDVLLHENLVTPRGLKHALEKSKAEGLRLGKVLVRERIVSEADVLTALCKINKDIYLELSPTMVSAKGLKLFGRDFLRQNLVVPLMETGQTMVLAISNPDDKERVASQLRDNYHIGKEIRFVYATKRNIKESLSDVSGQKEHAEQLRILEGLIDNGTLRLEEGIIALGYEGPLGIMATLRNMGFLRSGRGSRRNKEQLA